jgi:hypothetical protein
MVTDLLSDAATYASAQRKRLGTGFEVSSYTFPPWLLDPCLWTRTNPGCSDPSPGFVFSIPPNASPQSQLICALNSEATALSPVAVGGGLINWVITDRV